MKKLNKILDRVKRLLILFRMLITRDGWKKAEWMKKHKIFYHMGEHCYYQLDLGL